MDDLIIRTRTGLVQGSRQNGARAWQGIPFAEAPVGVRRFRKPVPAATWDGVRPALKAGPLATQPVDPSGGIFGLSRADIPQSEDCLNVNVWAPDASANEPMPVMVWIHGGSFLTGGGGLAEYDGSVLARRGGLIVVTLSYRLGPFGFLHLAPFSDEQDGEKYTSNTGLLDQIAALEWVRDNIAAFGGDPGRVTVFGESAGSMSIAALLAMPAAKGLFSRAIMQSGASQALTDAQGRMLAQAYLGMLGIENGELHRLAELPASAFMQAEARLRQEYASEAIMLFQPVVDGDTLPLLPLQAVAAGSAAGIEIMIGTNLHEGALFIREESHLLTPEQAADMYTVSTGTPEAREWVTGYPVTVDGQQQMMTELYFWRTAVQFAEAQLGHGPLWMYRFDFTVEGHSIFDKAFHLAEIPFAFFNLDLLQSVGLEINEDMRQMAVRTQNIWLAFAWTGNPSTEELEWPTYELPERYTLLIDAESRVVSDPDADKRKLLTGAGA